MSASWSGPETDAEGPASTEIVELTLPLHTRHAMTIRLVVSSLAAAVGFTVDEIDDLRLGVSELVSVLADVDTQAGARLGLTFLLSPSRIVVRAQRSGVPATIGAPVIDELVDRILSAVVDSHTMVEGVLTIIKTPVGAASEPAAVNDAVEGTVHADATEHR